MTEQRQKLIDRFQRWLDTKPNKRIIASQCATIAEEYHAEQLRIADVVGRSEQLPCKHEHIKSSDGCDECMDCGVRNF